MLRGKSFKAGHRARFYAGFSLIEAVIGIALMGFALLGLAQLFMMSVYNNMRGGEISHATFLAQQQIDYLRTLTADELNNFPSSARGERVDEPLDVNKDGTVDFRRITQVQATSPSYGVKVLIFPASQLGTALDALLQNPGNYRVRATMNTVISR